MFSLWDGGKVDRVLAPWRGVGADYAWTPQLPDELKPARGAIGATEGERGIDLARRANRAGQDHYAIPRDELDMVVGSGQDRAARRVACAGDWGEFAAILMGRALGTTCGDEEKCRRSGPFDGPAASIG
jgi:hypothetical protein